MLKVAIHTAALMVGGVASKKTWDGPLSGAALKASQALRTARYTTVRDMVRICPSLGTSEQVDAAIADREDRDSLLRRWADLAATWAREEAI